ncbi:MAG: GNAT family N-acetyltransferase [Fermentimonas sp.]|jgi:GNAT superfamily N-acetyltransferase
MDFFIFDFQKDQYLINSFLKEASSAHKQKEKTAEWFHWKFTKCPYGRSLLACAKENEEIAGCVAFGRQDFFYNNQRIKGAISFETFVSPKHQGKGLFKKLTSFAEAEAKNIGIEILLNFPNSISLSGFLKMGWQQIDVGLYFLKLNNPLHVIQDFKSLRKSFIPEASNISSLDNAAFTDFQQHLNLRNELTPEITQEYLEWRFLTFPVSKYITINNSEFYSVARIGYRGNLSELQILLIEPKMNTYYVSINQLIKEYKKICKFDVIGICKRKLRIQHFR